MKHAAGQYLGYNYVAFGFNQGPYWHEARKVIVHPYSPHGASRRLEIDAAADEKLQSKKVGLRRRIIHCVGSGRVGLRRLEQVSTEYWSIARGEHSDVVVEALRSGRGTTNI
ncbi:cytochrome P450 [Striga asiatica]|uniref:Cytochrome P450 n=1 Tax=Striga asiatica TaxID=4170 RepID=A0A5A7PRD6_STRAF|nr:cytochrome P450 [Striga asiatica]